MEIEIREEIKMIYTVTLNPAIDYIVSLEQFESGKVNRSNAEYVLYGGKGINVSTVLHRMGIETTAWGFVAGFTGNEIERGVRSLGVKTDFIHLTDGISRINVKIKSDEVTELNGQGPEISEENLYELYQQFQFLKDGDILVFAGSIPSSLPVNLYDQMIQYCRQQQEGKNIRFVVDASGEALREVLKNHPFLIKPNHHELGALFGRHLKDKQEIVFYAKELQKQGAENVLVSCGKQGAILLTKDGRVFENGILEGKVIQQVGAGDSMLAGFLASYLAKQDYEEALKWGTAAGNATAFSEGLAEKELIETLYQQL